ncbi:hypothetical protein SAMN05444411_102100 [Lutibacter oricola]|uniref:Uncharacterized protein n=1 Tax=Lutibacter oricola TaxID=762486 RepID=A0A1H2W3E0_9FLAO|nr:hypothetical protein [Lutibacter oricola]SDW75035.1 hypothetical protein SAMN05444411_102100 [Lutibacter oricola]
MKKIFVLILIITTHQLFSFESSILVTESTISLNRNQTEELYFSFAKGDIIEFSFNMVKGKSLKNVEIFSLPNHKLFSEFKAKSIQKKQFHVNSKGLYLFRFKNTALTKRVCKIIIKRTPKNEETKNFNTNWKWKTVNDTIYTPYKFDSIIGYKTTDYTKNRKLINTETIEEVLIDKNQRIHSYYNGNSNKTYFKVSLPTLITTPTKEEKTIAWAYWIGVGNEAQEAYKKDIKTIGDIAKELSTKYKTPITELAIGSITQLFIPKKGDDVSYNFLPTLKDAKLFKNGELFETFDSGKGIVAYGKNEDKTTGTFYLGLHNDNQIQEIDVSIKIVAIKKVEHFKIDKDFEIKKEAIIKTFTKQNLHIKKSKIRIPVE